MIAACKLLFDLSFYYTISGFYLYMITETPASGWGFVLLAGAAVIHVLVKTRLDRGGASGMGGSLNRIICCLLPLALLFFRPTIGQLVQFLPAWGYIGFSIMTGSLETTKAEFRQHFGLTAKLLLLIAPGFFIVSRCFAAFNISLMYFVPFLLLGIALMRMLREEGRLPRGQTLAILLGLFGVSAALFALQVLNGFAATAGFLYEKILSKIIFGIVVVLGSALYGLMWLLRPLLALFKEDSGENAAEISLESGIEYLMGEQEFIDSAFPKWVVYLGYALLAIAVCAVVFLIFRRLLGARKSAEKKSLYSEERESLRDEGDRKSVV